MIIDASGQILGRLSSEVAKILLNGEEVTIINAEKSIITGRPDEIKERYKQKWDRGDPLHGPYYPKTSDGIVKRSIRGMLPYKKPRGREALKKLRVHIGNPDNLKGEKLTKDKKDIECRYITLEDLTFK